MSNPNDQENEQTVPIANVGRIMVIWLIRRRVCPKMPKLPKRPKKRFKNAFQSLSNLLGLKVNALIASDRCLQEKRKTVNSEDILWALEALGFDNYSSFMAVYMEKQRATPLKPKVKNAKFQDQDLDTMANAQLQMANLIGQHQISKTLEEDHQDE